MGSHVFYRNRNGPSKDYKFELMNVMDDGVNDDYDNYQLGLLTPTGTTYMQRDGQEIVINVPSAEMKIGEQTAKISSIDSIFVNTSRKFFALDTTENKLEIPLITKLKPGELAVVLTWQQGVEVKPGTMDVVVRNLDLHVEFQPQDDVLCTVDHATRQCNGVKLTTDSELTNGKFTSI